MDTLFDIFCECAELNPEPIDGEYHSFILNWTLFWISYFSWCCINCVFFFSCIPFNFLCMLSSGEEEEHNWIFSADQMVDEVAGIGWTVKIDACVFVCLHLFNMFVFSEEGDHFSQDPTNSIGHSNGDHDLARTVLEVGLLVHLLCCLGAPTFSAIWNNSHIHHCMSYDIHELSLSLSLNMYLISSNFWYEIED